MADGPADFPQTPLFRAQGSDRYARQDTIRQIEKLTQRQLVVYEANISSPYSAITEADIQPFYDLLAHIPSGANLDLMIQSPGGYIDATEKLVYMCRLVGSTFRLIVPEYAKSAATLIALASDEIVMGLASELGPIDPQLPAPGPGGSTFQTSAQTVIDEFDKIVEEVDKTGTLSKAYLPLLNELNLGFIGMCRNVTKRSRTFASKWLKKYMLKRSPRKAASVAKDLCNVKKWLTHGVVIDADEATKLGLTVNKLDKDDALWKNIWYLHCCYGVLFRTTPVSKIFESATVSLAFQ
jgi:hypothetical protein